MIEFKKTGLIAEQQKPINVCYEGHCVEAFEAKIENNFGTDKNNPTDIRSSHQLGFFNPLGVEKK